MGADPKGTLYLIERPLPGLGFFPDDDSNTNPDSVADVHSNSINEGFDDITQLVGMGWFMQNNSQPLGTTNWFEGSSAVFPAFDGAYRLYCRQFQ